MKIRICAKCSDCCYAAVETQEGDLIHEEDGYVPKWFFGGGDYIDLIIDNRTGQILDWKPIKKEDFQGEDNE
jgi:hypothetical protein